MRFLLFGVLLCCCTASAQEVKQKDVPVVRTQVDNDLPVAKTGDESGLMPINFIKNRLDNVKVGTAVYVTVDAVKVDSKRRSWLDPNHVYTMHKAANQITVMRDQAGYHLYINSLDHEWEAKDQVLDKMIPLKTITVK